MEYSIELQVLLYDGQNEHLAVELFNGRIRVSYDVGNHPVSTMYSFEVKSFSPINFTSETH